MSACTGNGGSANSNGDVYNLNGSTAGSSGGGSASGSSGGLSGSFTAEDLLNAANSGDPGRIIELISTAPAGDESGETTTIVLSAADLGLPANGTVTLTISGAISFDETKGAADDGTVTFIIPKVVTGKTVTLELSVKDETGFVIYYGKETGPVEGSGNLDITLTGQFRTMPAAADRLALYAGGAAGEETAVITITEASGTPSVSAADPLLTIDPPVQDPVEPTTYTMTVSIAGGATPPMFADDTTAGLTITDGGSGRATLSFTLKNKYTVQVEYTASGGSITSSELSTPYMQGSSITFAEASSVVTSTQGNRGVASFKYGSSTVLYKTAAAGATSVTINSTNFPGLTSRIISLEAVLNLGSKPAPDAVGDIVFSDGTVSAYTETLTATQIAEAAAIIFDAGSKKGVGVNIGTGLQWAGGDWMSSDPNRGYNIQFNTSDDDGSGNWAVIQARDPAGSADAATWYPAFNWVNSYSAAGFTSGWYMPAKNELKTLVINRTAVEAAFTALGMASPSSTGGEWVSSSQNSSVQFVVCLDWLAGNVNLSKRKTNEWTVVAVRVFN